MESSYKSQTVGAVIVTHNNAATLERCLESVKWADEIVVVDHGSTDGTLDIARKFTNRIYFHPSPDTLVQANYGLSWLTTGWVMLVQPYEWVEEMLRHEIDGLMLNPSPDVSGYAIPIKLHFQTHWISKGGFYPERQVRLFRRGKGTLLDNANGLAVSIEGNPWQLDRALCSAPYTSYCQLFNDVNRRSIRAAYAAIEAGEVGILDRTVMNLLWQIKWVFVKRFFIQGGMADGFNGLAFVFAEAMATFLKQAKIRSILQTR